MGLLLLILASVVPASGAQSSTIVVRDVTVIDPRSGATHGHRDVVVRDGRVAAVSPASAGEELPGDATIVDGSGRFLIPGLWDLHVHLDMHTEADLAMLLVNGVLSVRDMGGDPFLAAELKQRIAAGELVGPKIYAAGSILEDRRWLTRARSQFPDLEHRLPVDNPEEARALVALLASWGVDLVKIRNVTDEATLRAILAAARDHGLTVAGHEPVVVDLDEAARLGMTTFEHLPFLTLTMPGKAAGEERLAETTAALLESGSYLVPTLITSRQLGEPREEREAALERPDPRYRYLPKMVKDTWMAGLDADPGPLPWAQMRAASLEIARRMHAAGVPLLAGTDMGVPLTFPGYSLHDELGLMVSQLGLSPLEGLRAATSAPAALFGIPGGDVRPGSLADLVLLDGNPLESVTATQRIRAVIARGELYDRDRLDAILEEVRTSKDDFAGWSTFERLERSCAREPGASCQEQVAGYLFSQGRYAEAHARYEQAVQAGAGGMAVEGLFSSAVNLLFAGELECAEAPESLDLQLERYAASVDRIVGTLSRLLPALASSCESQRRPYLERLAQIEEAALSRELQPIYREHYASYLAEVEGNEDAAYETRVSLLEGTWQEDTVRLQEVATWCLAREIKLDKARELAQRAASVAQTPIDRLQSMMLEARIASAAGDHQAAVALMETIDRAVPNNRTVTSLLEEFRRRAQ